MFFITVFLNIRSVGSALLLCLFPGEDVVSPWQVLVLLYTAESGSFLLLLVVLGLVVLGLSVFCGLQFVRSGALLLHLARLHLHLSHLRYSASEHHCDVLTLTALSLRSNQNLTIQKELRFNKVGI